MRACLYVTLILGLGEVSCDDRLWQNYSQNNPDNCTVESQACPAEMQCNSLTQVCEAALDITSVEPTLASGAGGTPLIIRGTNFRPNSSVFFGTLPNLAATATDVTVVSDTMITATLPANAGSAWKVPVTVSSPGLSATRSGLFSYFAQSLSFDVKLIGSVQTPTLVATGDINNDQKLDVVFLDGNSGSLTTFFGKGDGTMTLAASRLLPNPQQAALKLVDLNGDKSLDVVAPDSQGVTVCLNNQQGSFAAPQSYSSDPLATSVNAHAIAIGDWNLDGVPDLAVANSLSNTFTTLLNNGRGGFLPAVIFESGTGPEDLVSGDFNGDGRTDLITLSDSAATPIEVHLSNGQGGFTTASTPTATGCTPRIGAVADA